jgi:DNA-binding transcriptional MerR regulator/effector-binding domain-containing protein
MDALVSIGDFAKMTYLSIKALRHYHDTGLLVPADVDPETGYRRYRADQVPAAQVIRRLRDLGMPLDDVKAVLDAPDLAARNAGISAHLRRMEQQLQQAQATVASLRRLLEEPPPAIAVEYQATAPERVLALRSQAAMDDSGQWWSEAFDELHAVLAAAVGLRRSGPDGALYPAEFFQAGSGEVTAFIPVAGQPHRAGRPLPVLDLPGAELAVAVHHGSFADLDTTYGALGSFVAGRAIGIDGPIRENYLVTPYDTADEGRHQTEVCWPVFLTSARST